jgi:hypothetical protein
VPIPPSPEELLDAVEQELELIAEADETLSSVGRREFVFTSLVAAAATTFGARVALGQSSVSSAAQQQQQQALIQLGNGEPPASQFMPYPGGTGALMEKMVREHGAKAFERSVFRPEKWSGPVPTSDDEIAYLPAHRLAALIRDKKLTSTRLTSIYVARLKRLDPTLNCAVTILETQALAEAAAADREIAGGRYRGPLHGLPYGLKDLFSTKGSPTTWGARDFESRVIDEDAEIVVRLREAGAVLVAKLSTGLFAQNDQWFRGRTNNPWNLSQGSSGSSAGPASATAAGCVAFGIGTETSGSIVSPSIRCGVSALRPTFGRVSRHGGMVLAWSQDRVGPICRTVEDCAMVFNAIHGVDPKDPSTVFTPFTFDRNIKLSSLRIGVDPAAPKELVDTLRALGVQPKEIGARPTLQGVAGLGVEGAAAFDEYVQRKAKEIGLDLTSLPEPRPAGAPASGGGGGGGVGGGAGTPADTTRRAGPPPNPMAPADWNPRFVNGRRTRAIDFMQAQRRRYVLIARWAEFMKDLDMFVGTPQADTGTNAQTGHPCVVVPCKFDVPVQGRGGGGGGGGGGGANPANPPAAPTTPLAPQPICGVITGALYNDDKILSVAHLVQQHNGIHMKHPSL